MIIEISTHEQLVCELIGTLRRKNAMQFNNDRQVSKQNPYDMDIDGFKGEFMVAKFLNVMPDFSLNERKNPTDLVYRGKTIDVKATRNPRGDLYVTEYHLKKPCDWYILINIDGLQGTLLGWYEGKNIKDNATLIDRNNHKSYFIPNSSLNTIQDLENVL